MFLKNLFFFFLPFLLISQETLPFFFKERTFSLSKKEKVLFLLSKKHPKKLLENLENTGCSLFIFTTQKKKELQKQYTSIDPDYIVLPLSQQAFVEKTIKNSNTQKKPLLVFYLPSFSKQDLLLKQLGFSKKEKVQIKALSHPIKFKENEISTFLFEIQKNDGKDFLQKSLMKSTKLPISLSETELFTYLSKTKKASYVLLPDKKALSLENKKKVTSLEKKLFTYFKKNNQYPVFIHRYKVYSQEGYTFHQESSCYFDLKTPQQLFKKKEATCFLMKRINSE